MKTVPEAEITLAFARGSGPGGQNVNKTETKVEARWNIGASLAFSEEEKTVIRGRLANRITAEDELLVCASDERSQEQNRANAIERLQALVDEALTPEKPRIPTKPTRASRTRRLEVKVRKSRVKKLRKSPLDE